MSLTRKRWIPPGGLSPEGLSIVRSLQEYLLSLEGKGSLALDEAYIRAASGIVFPATQNASSDVNTLDDYKEVTDQAITVTSNSGTITEVSGNIDYTKVGREVWWQAHITITTNGTGASYIKFTFPFTAAGLAPLYGSDAGGVALSGYINGPTVVCVYYDGTYPGADGRQLIIGGHVIV